MSDEIRFTRAPGLDGRETGAQRGCHVCPAWLAPFLDNPLRRLLIGSRRLAERYLPAGMVVVDVGCGSAPLMADIARVVGSTGEIVCVDLQRGMLERAGRKAGRLGLGGRVRLHQCALDTLGLEAGLADFAIAFWMLHEVPDQERLLREVAACLKPGGRFLIVEPRFHVSREAFEKSLELASAAGLSVIERPRVTACIAAVVEKPADLG
jgi:ubiquinone/menaquinone biosynthesis C-methylase UbiE